MGESQSRVFDFNRLEEVTGGDAEFEQELLQEFLEDTPSVFTRLSQAVAGADWKTVVGEAHGPRRGSPVHQHPGR